MTAEAAPVTARPLASLRLTVRCRTALTRHGLATIGDVTALTDGGLLGIDGVGDQHAGEVRRKLAARGLTLRPDPPTVRRTRTRNGMRDVGRETGRRLRDARNARGWSLLDVERISGGYWTAVSVGSYERSDRTVSVPGLLELARFYDVPVASLLPPDPAGAFSLTAMALAEDGPAVVLREVAEWLETHPALEDPS